MKNSVLSSMGKAMAYTLLLLGIPARADEAAKVPQFFSGDHVLNMCDSRTNGACLAYLGGAADVMSLAHQIGIYRACIPTGISFGQLYDVAVPYLRSHPVGREGSGVIFVAAAYAEAWPCA